MHQLIAALISALTAVSAATPATVTNQPTPAAPPAAYHLVLNTGQLTAQQQRQLAAHRTRYGKQYTAQRVVPFDTNPNPPDDLRTPCKQQLSAGTTPDGWIPDRFHQCIHSIIDALVVRDSDGGIAGEIKFDFWILGWASNGNRQVQTRVTIDANDATVSGVGIDWPNQHIDLLPTGCIPSELLTCPAEPHKTLAEWAQAPDYDMFFTSPTGTGASPDFTVSNLLTTIGFEIGTLPIRPGTFTTAFQSAMRFDTGRRMAPADGAVFWHYTPTFSLSLTDSAVNESATHIRDAQFYPIRTFPSWPGKTVPGKAGGSEPLHRLVDDTLQAANRAASVAFCKDVWGPNYATGGKQCDEYPFASTYEGAITGTVDNPGLTRVSVRPINGGDNGLAGARLGAFFGAQRLLDNDPFYVGITP